jgi:hypothetical protein
VGKESGSFLVTALLVYLLMVACSLDPKAPTKRTFERVIAAQLEKDRACIVVQLPLEIPDFQGKHRPDPEIEPLVHLGLVTKVATNVKPQFGDIGLLEKPHDIPGLRYDLAQAATRYRKNDPRTSAMSMIQQSQQLCFADKKLVNVVRWTEPSLAFGRTMVEVTYTYKLVNVANWAKDPDIERVYYATRALAAADQPQESKIGLVLMSDGWRVPDSMF